MHRRGFTLVELLVVCAIIMALVSLLLPSFGKARAAAALAKCGSQQHQLGLGIAYYAVDYRGVLPPVNATTNTLSTTHWPYWFFVDSTNNPWNLGFAYKHGSIREPRILFCPGDPNAEFYQTPQFPNLWPGPPSIAGVRLSYNFNPMTVNATNRARLYTTLAGFATDGLLLYDTFWVRGSMHQPLYAYTTTRGDQSVRVVYDQTLSDVIDIPNIISNNYAAFDQQIEKLLGRRWY